MTKSNCLNIARGYRSLWTACFITLASGSVVAPVLADDTRLDDGAKKAGNNFGELLKGMGQELKKAGGTLTDSGKKEKDGTKEKKHTAPESEKDQDKPSK